MLDPELASQSAFSLVKDLENTVKLSICFLVSKESEDSKGGLQGVTTDIFTS